VQGAGLKVSDAGQVQGMGWVFQEGPLYSNEVECRPEQVGKGGMVPSSPGTRVHEFQCS